MLFKIFIYVQILINKYFWKTFLIKILSTKTLGIKAF